MHGVCKEDGLDLLFALFLCSSSNWQSSDKTREFSSFLCHSFVLCW